MDETIPVIIHENTTVLELGSAILRIGYGGESTPRHVVPSPINFQSERRSVKEWILYLKPIMAHIFYNLLLLKQPKQSPLLSSPNTPGSTTPTSRILVLGALVSCQSLKCALAHILLHDLSYTSLLFVPGASFVTSMYCFAQTNLLGLVVDLGHKEARCCVSYQGRCLISTIQAAPCGYENFMKIFQSHYNQFYSEIDGVTPLNDQDARSAFREATCLMLNDEKLVMIECTRSSTGEIIHVPKQVVQATWDEVLEGPDSLPTMILNCLKACPIDLRKRASQRIVLVGGGVPFARRLLDKRIKEECLKTALSDARFSSLEPSCRNMDLLWHVFAPDLLPWLGGSIIGTMPLTDEQWIFRQAWLERYSQDQEKGLDVCAALIPDWLNTVNA